MQRFFFTLFVFAIWLTGPYAVAQTPDADTLIRQAQNISKVPGYEADIELENIDADGKIKVRRIYTATRLNLDSKEVMRLARFTQPLDFKGTTTLIHENASRDDDIWLLLPSVKKVKKLLSNGRKDRFLGTEFSYGDVVGYKETEWTNQLGTETVKDGTPCLLVISLPKTRDIADAYGYTRRVTCIRKNDFFPIEVAFWDLDDIPSKIISSTDTAVVAPGKVQAMKVTAINLIDKQRSVLTFKSYKLNASISKDIFRAERLDAN